MSKLTLDIFKKLITTAKTGPLEGPLKILDSTILISSTEAKIKYADKTLSDKKQFIETDYDSNLTKAGEFGITDAEKAPYNPGYGLSIKDVYVLICMSYSAESSKTTSDIKTIID